MTASARARRRGWSRRSACPTGGRCCRSPADWTARVLAFLDLPWDERCLRHEEAQRTVFTASALQVREKIVYWSVGIFTGLLLLGLFIAFRLLKSVTTP